jgi:hypothetical protein
MERFFSNLRRLPSIPKRDFPQYMCRHLVLIALVFLVKLINNIYRYYNKEEK